MNALIYGQRNNRTPLTGTAILNSQFSGEEAKGSEGGPGQAGLLGRLLRQHREPPPSKVKWYIHSIPLIIAFNTR